MRLRLSLLTAMGVLIVLPSLAQGESTNQSPLHAQARYVALHGGIRSSRYSDATWQMQYLSRRLITERFSTAGHDAVRWALCVAGRESGYNPGAINSSSGAAGLFQFLGHPQYSYWSLTHDPVYEVNAAWALSHGARDRSPWYGGNYRC